MRTCIFIVIVGIASGFLTSKLRFVDTTNYSLGLTTPPADFALIAHHKTGTALLRLLTREIAKMVRIELKDIKWKAIDLNQDMLTWQPNWDFADPFEVINTMMLADHLSHVCNKNTILLFEDMRPKVFEKLLSRCKNLRVVHLVRRPSSVVLSNWAYTKNLKLGMDRIEDVSRGAFLKTLPLALGIRSECDKFYMTYADQMLSSHSFIQKEHSNLMLEVRYEDLETNYDNTTRKIFEHLLGKTHPSIDNLVTKARAHDKHRMSKTEVSFNKHISNERDKNIGKKEMVKMHKAGDPCMARLTKDDAFMGYTEEWW